MIGTAVKYVFISGGGASGLNIINVTIDVAGPEIQSDALIGATEIVSIDSMGTGIINSNIDFDSVTGTISMRVEENEVFTITFKKP